MEPYPEVMEGRSPQRGEIILYQDQPSMSSTEDSDLIDDQQRLRASLPSSPINKPPHNDRFVRIKKTSCPTGPITRREKPIRSRPKSLAFDQDMIDMHNGEWLSEHADSSVVSKMKQPEYRIRKYKSVISLSSDNTSSVDNAPQQMMSRSVHQSPVKQARTPKMIDVSPQYLVNSNIQVKSKEQGGSRVKQLLFRRISRTSETKNEDYVQNRPVHKRSKSSSSPNTMSNIRFLRKKSEDNEESYLLNSPYDDDDNINVSHNPSNTNTITSEYHPMSYSSGEESN